MKSERYDAVIVGGGLAGLSAAVELASTGANIALFEQTPRLGGRCYSFRDETTGDIVDNGQHILIGAYHNTLAYLERIGSVRHLDRQRRLSIPFFHPELGFVSFQTQKFPQPFDLLAAILTFKPLSFMERIGLIKLRRAINDVSESEARRLASVTVEHWLDEHHQSRAAKKHLWYPLAVSVLNELPDRACAALFVGVLRSVFLGSSSDAALIIPTIGQTELYVEGAEAFLRKYNVSVRTKTEVSGFEIEGMRAVGLRLSDGTVVKSDAVISAVPYHCITRLLPPNIAAMAPFVHCDTLDTSPIVSVHLWFDKEFMDITFVGLTDRRTQWVFNRRRIFRETEKSDSYLTAVISGAHELVDTSKDELIRIVLADLADVFPESVKVRLVSSLVIKEKRATFAPTPKAEELRPSTRTPIDRLYLAGDWTDTGLPATIEGAVLSGVRAAECVQSGL